MAGAQPKGVSPANRMRVGAMKDCLKCAAGTACTSDIKSCDEIHYHMMLCMHVLCSNCYTPPAVPTTCSVCGMTTHLPSTSFRRCFYLEKLLELYRFTNKELSLCQLCQERNHVVECANGSCRVCQECSNLTHTCPSGGPVSLEPHVFLDILRRCTYCPTLQLLAEQTPKFLCPYEHGECPGGILVCEDHRSHGNVQHPVMILPLAFFSTHMEMMRGIVKNLIKVLQEALTNNAQDPLGCIQKTHAFIERLTQLPIHRLTWDDRDFIIQCMQETHVGLCTLDESLSRIKDLVLQTRNRLLYRQIKKHQESLKEYRSHETYILKLLGFFKRAKVHMDMIVFMCRDDKQLEAIAYSTIASVICRGAQIIYLNHASFISSSVDDSLWRLDIFCRDFFMFNRWENS